MADIDLPVPGHDEGTWGHKTNAAIEAINEESTEAFATASEAISTATEALALVEAIPGATWETIPEKPPVVAAGDTEADALASIGGVPETRTVAGKPLTGDVSLAKADVGLGNVDNTADTAKPISTAVQAALDGKSATSHTHTAAAVGAVPTTRTVAGKALSSNVTLAKGDVGLGSVDNTSDLNKPISTATQAALTSLRDAVGVSPEQYGAVGDGTTSDAQAFRDAVAAANGRVLRLTPGKVYRLTSSVTISPAQVRAIIGNNAQILVTGSFTGLAIVGSHTGSANPADSTIALRDSEFHFLVDSVRMRCATTTGAPTGVGISFTGCMGIHVTNSYFSHLATAVRFHGVNRNAILTTNDIYFCGTGVHFDTSDLHQVILSSNHMSYCTYAIRSVNSPQHNTLVVDNDIEANATTAGDPTSLVLISRNANTIDTEKWTFTGNQFDDHSALTGPMVDIAMGDSAVGDVDNAHQFAFVGNTFGNGLNGGIRVSGGQDVVVRSNTFHRVRSWAVQVLEGSRGVVVEGNLMEGQGVDTFTSGLVSLAVTRSHSDARIVGNVVRSTYGIAISVSGAGTLGILDVSDNTVKPVSAGEKTQVTAIAITPTTVRVLRVCNNSGYGRQTYGFGRFIQAAAGTTSSGVIRQNVAYYLGGAAVTAYTLPSATSSLLVSDNIAAGTLT